MCDIRDFKNCGECSLIIPCADRIGNYPTCTNVPCNGRLGNYPSCFAPPRVRVPSIICHQDGTQESVVVCMEDGHHRRFLGDS